MCDQGRQQSRGLAEEAAGAETGAAGVGLSHREQGICITLIPKMIPLSRRRRQDYTYGAPNSISLTHRLLLGLALLVLALLLLLCVLHPSSHSPVSSTSRISPPLLPSACISSLSPVCVLPPLPLLFVLLLSQYHIFLLLTPTSNPLSAFIGYFSFYDAVLVVILSSSSSFHSTVYVYSLHLRFASAGVSVALVDGLPSVVLRIVAPLISITNDHLKCERGCRVLSG